MASKSFEYSNNYPPLPQVGSTPVAGNGNGGTGTSVSYVPLEVQKKSESTDTKKKTTTTKSESYVKLRYAVVAAVSGIVAYVGYRVVSDHFSFGKNTNSNSANNMYTNYGQTPLNGQSSIR